MADWVQDERRWTILNRRDWPDDHGSLLHPKGPTLEPDDQLEVIEVVPVSSLDQALAERDRLAEVAGELAEALEQIQTAEVEVRRAPITDERYVSRTAEDVMRDIADGALVAHYESLRGGPDG